MKQSVLGERATECIGTVPPLRSGSDSHEMSETAELDLTDSGSFRWTSLAQSHAGGTGRVQNTFKRDGGGLFESFSHGKAFRGISAGDKVQRRKQWTVCGTWPPGLRFVTAFLLTNKVGYGVQSAFPGNFSGMGASRKVSPIE